MWKPRSYFSNHVVCMCVYTPYVCVCVCACLTSVHVIHRAQHVVRCAG